MNQQDIEVFKALGRINRFSATHGSALPAGSIAATEFARCVTVAGETGPDNSTPASPATGALDHLFDKVWEDLKAVSGTARTINTKEPGFSTRFRLAEDAHGAILATADDFLEHLQDAATVAKFVAYLLPADFVTTLQADLAKISGKGEEQTDDQLADVGDTAETRALIKEGRALIKSLNTSVRNFFRAQPEILAEWRAASASATPAAAAIPKKPPPPRPERQRTDSPDSGPFPWCHPNGPALLPIKNQQSSLIHQSLLLRHLAAHPSSSP